MTSSDRPMWSEGRGGPGFEETARAWRGPWHEDIAEADAGGRGPERPGAAHAPSSGSVSLMRAVVRSGASSRGRSMLTVTI